MTKKGATKKLLTLLVIMLALGLVVDLLFLNALYGVNKSGTLKGALASAWSNCALNAEADRDTEFSDLSNEYKQKYEAIDSAGIDKDDEYSKLIKWYEEELRKITSKYDRNIEACDARF